MKGFYNQRPKVSSSDKSEIFPGQWDWFELHFGGKGKHAIYYFERNDDFDQPFGSKVNNQFHKEKGAH